jgi:hypothetical protein
MGAALLALTATLARPALAQEPLPVDGGGPHVRLNALPCSAQPGSLVHATVEIETARFRPAFFDVFFDAGRFRPAFFDVFYASETETELVPLALVGGIRMRDSYELLVQMPLEGLKPGDGSVIVMLDGKPVAKTPMRIQPLSSPVLHVLGSGQGISSFFDIFTELSLDGGAQGIDSFFDVFTELSLDGGQRVVDSFFDIFTELSLEARGPRATRKLRAIRRLIQELLRQSIGRERSALGQLYAADARGERALKLLRCLANEEATAIARMLSPGQ